MHWQTGHVTDRTLHRRRTLCRRIDLYAALGRNGIRTLRLDIEMFLAVDVDPSLKKMFRGEKCLGRVAKLKSFWRNDEITVRGGYARIGNRLECFDLYNDLLCRLSS